MSSFGKLVLKSVGDLEGIGWLLYLHTKELDNTLKENDNKREGLSETDINLFFYLFDRLNDSCIEIKKCVDYMENENEKQV